MANPAFRPLLAIDFNGVIHDHVNGPGGKEALPIDSPAVFGSIDFLCRMVETFNVALTSARFARPGAAGLDAMIECRAWLIHRGVKPDWITFDPDRTGRVFLTGCKVPSLVILDDRAVRFDGTFPNASSLMAFKPWNAK